MDWSRPISGEPNLSLNLGQAYPDSRGEKEKKRGENHGPNGSLKEKECERWPNGRHHSLC